MIDNLQILLTKNNHPPLAFTPYKDGLLIWIDMSLVYHFSQRGRGCHSTLLDLAVEIRCLRKSSCLPPLEALRHDPKDWFKGDHPGAKKPNLHAGYQEYR